MDLDPRGERPEDEKLNELTFDDLAEAVGNLIVHVNQIERVLVAQLTDRRDRLAAELSFAKGSSRPNWRQIAALAKHLETASQQLEELGHAD